MTKLYPVLLFIHNILVLRNRVGGFSDYFNIGVLGFSFPTRLSGAVDSVMFSHSNMAGGYSVRVLIWMFFLFLCHLYLELLVPFMLKYAFTHNFSLQILLWSAKYV